MSTQTICIWADGTWCHREEVEQMNHMSDDYIEMSMSDELDDNQIDRIVHEYMRMF